MPLGLLALFIQLFLPQCQLLLKFTRRLGGFGLLLRQRGLQAFLLLPILLPLILLLFLQLRQLLLQCAKCLGGFCLLLRQLSGGRLFVLLITLARFIVGGLRRRQFLLPGVIRLFRQRRQPLFQQGDTPIALLGLLFFLR
ncbi:Uncharacterised protein [Serratia marcescens]|nr:Uncharacterised protein [Serratia marcescens]